MVHVKYKRCHNFLQKCRSQSQHACEMCGQTFLARKHLIRHNKTVRCNAITIIQTPSPKRSKLSERVTRLGEEIVEDAKEAPIEDPSLDAVSEAVLTVIRNHWSSIRTNIVRGSVQSRYNIRLSTLDTRDLEGRLLRIFDEQRNAFKVNLSYGFILRHKQTSRYRYYLASQNCCGRYLDKPSLLVNRKHFDAFLQRIQQPDVLQFVIRQRRDSMWVVERVTNVTFFVNIIRHHTIGCSAVALPSYLKNNNAIIGQEKNPKNGKHYRDNFCFFRCLALHRGYNHRYLETWVRIFYDEYNIKGVNIQRFRGVTLDELDCVEEVFQTNIYVYELNETEDGSTEAELLRRSLGSYPETLNVNLNESHFSFIQDMNSYCKMYRCERCGDSLWKTTYALHRHQRTCEAGVRRLYPGGDYYTPMTIFQQLDEESICVQDSLRYYPYRATFDIECYFDDTNLPRDSEKVQWEAGHELLSISVASNIPGFEQPRCFITDGNSEKLVGTMMSTLMSMSEVAYNNLKQSYTDVFEQLTQLEADFDKVEADLFTEAGEEREFKKKNPYTKLIERLHDHLRQLPVVGFNSGKYDLIVMKKFLLPHFLLHGNRKGKLVDEASSWFVIKKQNNLMCLSTNTLKFLDTTSLQVSSTINI